MIYLDNASTTKVNTSVLRDMLPYFCDDFYNPSSIYKHGINVQEDIEYAREQIAKSVNANPSEIYFTSGGSESNCWAIQGFVNYWRLKGYATIVITSSIEHKSILECVSGICALYEIVDVDSKGVINFQKLKQYLQFWTSVEDLKCKILVSIQYANNEIGTIQNVFEIAKLCHKYGAVFHTDAVQAYTHINCDVNALGIDMLSTSGHKFGACKGIGFLYIKQGIQISPLIYGTQNNGMRGGTENVPYIIGMASAINNTVDIESMRIVRDYAIDQLIGKFHVTLNGDSEFRLPNNINVTFPYSITSEAVIHILSTSDILLSAGSACNSYTHQPSHVLKAIGLSDEDAMRSIRISLSNDITKEMIDFVIQELSKAIKIIVNK